MFQPVRFVIATIFLLLVGVSCKTKQELAVNSVPSVPKSMQDDKPELARNVILLIGDGMGVTQITAGMYANGNKIAFEEFKKIGFHKNYAYDKLVTDSAAGATAFSCGKKTYNGAIGVGPDTIAIKTILEEANERGYKTGLVTTSTIVHATPASFVAHNRLRKNYEEIAVDMLDSGVDIFIGGGLKFFNNREDERDLLSDYRKAGYHMESFIENDVQDVDFTQYEKVGYLTANNSPVPASQGREYLPLATTKAIDFLEDKSGDEGFFLMVEGAQIDWGGHANDGAYITSEMIDFNQVIEAVLKYSEQHPETLVVITADHETGGFAINKNSTMDSLDMAFTSDYHTADIIPVFSKGPGSELFMGIYENTDIYHKMRLALGWEKYNLK